MLVHKSHISGKNKNILRCYLVIFTTRRRNRIIHVLRVICYINHLEKVPRGVKKAHSQSPMHTPHQKEYDIQVLSCETERETKGLVLRDKQLLSFRIPIMRNYPREPFSSLLLLKKTKDKRHNIFKPNFP